MACGTCHKALTGSWSKSGTGRRYGFYHCQQGCTNVPRATLETAFATLLDTLRPRAECWALLKAVVLDLWREERQRAGAGQAVVRRRITELEQKLTTLEDAFIFQRRIDEDSYQRHRDQIREDLTFARVEATQLEIDGLDVEGLLAFAEHTLSHASALWTAASSIDERIRVQWAVFPVGVTWHMELFQTPTNCLDFYDLGNLVGDEKGMVGLPWPTWNRLAAWLRHMQAAMPQAA